MCWGLKEYQLNSGDCYEGFTVFVKKLRKIMPKLCLKKDEKYFIKFMILIFAKTYKILQYFFF